MGSKSSSGSLMKSVESMLPKNMNMKHVLLAVLVGLLLCMLMGQTVEGIRNITGGSSNVNNSGICVPDILAISPTRCIAEKYNASGTAPEPATAPPSPMKTPLDEICGNIDMDQCSTANTSDNSSSKQTLLTRIRTYNSQTGLQTNQKVGGASGFFDASGEPKGYVSCKLQEVDNCGPASKEACKADTNCDWYDCGNTLGQNEFPFFGPSTPKGNPELDLDGGNFEKWRKCIFTNNPGGTATTGTPTITTVVAPPPAAAGNTHVIRATYPLAHPFANSVHAGITGKIVKGLNSGAAKSIDAGGDLSKGEVPTNADGGPTAVTGLTGWLRGKPGVARTKAQDGAGWTQEQLRAANAIPLKKDGMVPAELANYLPIPLKLGIQNQFKWCGFKQTADKASKVAVGWGDDLRSLKCLNYNDNIQSVSVQSHKPIYTCVDKTVQVCKKNSDNTSCGADDDVSSCYSTTAPKLAMVATAPGIGGKARVVLGTAQAQVKDNIAAGFKALSLISDGAAAELR